MSRGGARNRSGPQASESSGRSDRRGFSLTALPASYDGPIAAFPLPDPTERELALWREKWTGPHGAAWAQPSESWRLHSVAMWVRTAVRCEAPDAPASLLGQLHRFADQSGLTQAGLAEMGWKVAVDEVSAKAAEKKAKPASSRDRLSAVKANGT